MSKIFENDKLAGAGGEFWCSISPISRDTTSRIDTFIALFIRCQRIEHPSRVSVITRETHTHTHIHAHIYTHIHTYFRHTVTLSHYSSSWLCCVYNVAYLSFWHNVGASRAGSPTHADGKRSQLELFPAGNPPQSTNGKLCMGVSFSLSLSLSLSVWRTNESLSESLEGGCTNCCVVKGG